MDLPLYLAMTAYEIARANPCPTHCAYMACHFSSYAAGLSGFPRSLPEGAILILNDRIPVLGHDPALICKQLHSCAEQHHVSAILLDLQRPNEVQTQIIVQKILDTAACPVAVSHLYAKDLPCPVFVPVPPLDCSLESHLAAWDGREIWLEAAIGEQILTVTEKGCKSSNLSSYFTKNVSFDEPKLHCQYGIEIYPDKIEFSLHRTYKELLSLLEEAKKCGITKAVGLYQQLHSFLFDDDCTAENSVIK